MDYKHRTSVRSNSKEHNEFKGKKEKSKRNIIIKNYDIRHNGSCKNDKTGKNNKTNKNVKTDQTDVFDRFMYDLENWDKLEYTKPKSENIKHSKLSFL